MKFKINFSFSLVLICTLLLLTLPIRFFAALIFSILIHEIFHLIALLFCKVKIFSVCFRLSGAEILTEPMKNSQEFICALAGPLGSFFMALFIGHFPVLSLCSIAHGLFNCMPYGTADGSRVLYCGLQMILSLERAWIVYKWIQMFLLIVLVVLCIYVCLIYPVVLKYIPLALMIVFGKSPCKATRKKVQCP